MTLWFTGLSGAGKTTLARLVQAKLEARGHAATLLDGDQVRAMSPDLGFSPADRAAQSARVAARCAELEGRGVIALAALISPYRAARESARAAIGDFIEVYVRAPLEVVIARDVKGLYRRAIAGEITDFTGISAPYEPPLHPEITVDTTTASPVESAALILAALPLTARVR